MKLSDLLTLIPDASSHDKVSDAWKSIHDTAYQAGVASANHDSRAADRRIRELEGKVGELEATASGATEATRKAKDLESQVKALQTERESMLPIVTEHRDRSLREAVVSAARLKDPALVDYVVRQTRVELGQDGKLSEAQVKALQEWAGKPENSERVKPQEDTGSNRSGTQSPSEPHRIQAPPATGKPSPKVQAELARLPEAARKAAETRLAAEGLI